MNRASGYLIWTAVALLGAFAFGTIALAQGERISALWIVIAAVCVYLIAYRFYSRFIASKVVQLDGLRMTPAVKYNDGPDYVPTNRCVLFGHHFAAIAGAGPLVGPVLAAQMGYLPGSCGSRRRGVRRRGAGLHGAVHLDAPRRPFAGDRWRSRIGRRAAALTPLIGAFVIMVIIIAVLALVVVKALTHSPGERSPSP